MYSRPGGTPTVLCRGALAWNGGSRNPAALTDAGFEPVVEVAQHRRIGRIARILDLVVELVGIGHEVVQLLKPVVVTHVFSRRRAHRRVALIGLGDAIPTLDQDGAPPWCLGIVQNGQQGTAVRSGARLYACSLLDGGGHVEIVDELIARLVSRYARSLDH